jgi:plasmid stabilization system protein ParE
VEKRPTTPSSRNYDAAMPADLVWSVQAEQDLRELFDFLHDQSPSAAQAYVEGVLQCCERLRDFPESSRAYNSRYRVLVFQNHVIFYRYLKSSQKVIIAKVIDGRRDYGRILKDLLK